MPLKPFVPEYIVVHLAKPEEAAENVRVSFTDYIKNVASSEIYPTWPEASLRANILAQISFALNRIYTEWYRSMGYDFDITSSTQYDQKFIKNRDFFDSVVKITDEIFNNYVVKQGQINPYFTQYCDGRTTTCEGLSQWGSVYLANEGYIPYEILQYYYGDDINIVYNAPVRPNIPSYPGRPLKVGSSGNDVTIIKRELNRIAKSYPYIPKISPINPVFTPAVKTSVERFQEVFNLEVDGIVGKATWYKIKFIYSSVKKLADLYSEGLKLEDISTQYSSEIKIGDTGDEVYVIQYYLAVIAYFDELLPVIAVDGIFGKKTEEAVIAFQEQFGLNATGVVEKNTWNTITDIYDKTLNDVLLLFPDIRDELYPGRVLSFGMQGIDVRSLQNFINLAADKNAYIPKLSADGIFGPATENAVRIIQSRNQLLANGIVGPLTWNKIISLSKD